MRNRAILFSLSALCVLLQGEIPLQGDFTAQHMIFGGKFSLLCSSVLDNHTHSYIYVASLSSFRMPVRKPTLLLSLCT